MSSKVRSLLLPLGFLLLAASPGRSPQRWALLVGVNDYIEFGDEAGGDLRGPENDVAAVRDVLVRRYDFPADHVRTLLSRTATREAIRQAVTEWLTKNARPGDLAVFYFSGHGSLAPDDNEDEEDGLDETLCPADVLRNSTRNDIRDDELETWLGEVSGEVVVILDSCHSGTATRTLRGVRPRALARAAPPSRLGTRGLTGVTLDSTGMSDSGHVLEIAASAANQTAMDAAWGEPGQEHYGGAFTTHLVRKLWQAPPGVSYRDLFLNTVVSLKADRFAQDPQLTGPGTQALFGLPGGVAGPVAAAGEAQPPTLSLRLLQITGARALLSGGSDRGLTAGSLLRTGSGAVLRVTGVAAGEAVAQVEQGTALPGDTLSLLAFALPRQRVVVDVAHATTGVLEKLRSLLPDSAVTAFEAGASAPDLSLVSSAADSLLLLSRDGQVRAQLIADSAGLALIAARIEQEAAMREIANIENPAAVFRVELELSGGQRSFRVGDEISFRVRSERTGYLTLVDLGTDGGITVLYPTTDAAPQILAGQPVLLPSPDLVFSIGQDTPPGTGMVRAIVTASPLRLTATSDAVRLAVELRQALSPPGAHGMAAERAPLPTSWATSLVVYVVQQ